MSSFPIIKYKYTIPITVGDQNNAPDKDKILIEDFLNKNLVIDNIYDISVGKEYFIIRINPESSTVLPISFITKFTQQGITGGKLRKRHRHTTKCQKRKSRCPRKSIRKTQRRRRMRGG